MVCKEIKTSSALSLLKQAEGSSLNTPLNLEPKATAPTAYLCDSPDERPLLAQDNKNIFSDSFSLATPPSLFSAPMGGSLQKSVSFFAPTVAIPSSLPPPPSSPLARI